MSKSNKMSLRRAAALNRRALGIICKAYPKMVISRVAVTIWQALSPYVPIYLSARIIEELSTQRNTDELRMLVITTLILGAVIGIITALLNKWSGTHAAGDYYKVRSLLTRKLIDTDFVNIEDAKTLELLSKIEQCQNSGGWGLMRTLTGFINMISSVFVLLGGAAMTITLFTSRVPQSAGGYVVLNNPLFIVFFIALMVGVAAVVPYLDNRADGYWVKANSDVNFGNRLFSHFGFLAYNNKRAADMRIYRQDKMCKKVNCDNKMFGWHSVLAGYAKGPMGLLRACSAVLSSLLSAAVFVFICLKSLAGAFGIGMVTQYLSSIIKVNSGISGMLSAIGDMKNNANFLTDIFTFMDIPDTMKSGSLEAHSGDGGLEIEFKNVSFKYPGANTYALKNVSLKLKSGVRLAVVGENGSGKTTFIKLLCRLYDPTEGDILINGTSIRQIDYDAYMKLFSVVFQDFGLPAARLREVVASGCTDDDADVIKCLEKAGFGSRLSALENGLDTYIYKDYTDDGVDVSGGEAQKIAIARAIYKRSPFIVLDEPTAALDPIAEAEIYSRFNDIALDRTAIYISHRLSSCKFCDEIVVFDGGCAVQTGTHEGLLGDADGKYSRLWHAQSQYYTK